MKAVLGPSPWTLIMPTGGVEATRDSVRAWIEAGAAAVGIGSSLIRKDLVEKGDLAGIEGMVRSVLGWIEGATQEAYGRLHPRLDRGVPAG